MRCIAAGLIAAVVLLMALAGAGASPAHGQDNTAIAINTKDGTDIFKLAFKIARVNQDGSGSGIFARRRDLDVDD